MCSSDLVNSDFLSYGQGQFYFVAAALILLFSSIGGYFQIARIIENFDVISSNAQKRVILDISDKTHADAIVSPQAIEEPKVMYGTATPFPKGFMDASYSEGDGVTKFVVPLCLLLALAISGASYFLFEASVMSAITYFTSMLMVSCPLSISLIYNLPLYRCAKVLAPKGCCILGEKGVNDIEETSAILITGGDLYYGKNAPIYGIKPFVPDQLNQSITDMASIAVSLNMPAKQSLLNIINIYLSLIRDLSSYQFIPEIGVLTYFYGRTLLL